MNKDIVNRMVHIINKIRYYDYMYYIKNTSMVSDVDYDMLKKDLEELEQAHPNDIQPNSPTYRIGFQPTFDFRIHKHTTPMLSLKNTYLLKDVIQFINKDELWPIILEPKIDGISLSLTYLNGLIHRGVLRGNGYEGEDILDHLLYTNIPMKIPISGEVEIRGELYITNEDFPVVNQIRYGKKELIFQNSRNATSGIVRNKKIEYSNFLSFIPYYLRHNHKNYCNTQEETLKVLANMQFQPQSYLLIKDEEELRNSINMTNKSIATDGVVIKTNDLVLMESLGVTHRHPRGAIAYKFSNHHKEAQIVKILWQVSRNGKIIPVGEITPIILDNACIKRITLHNKNYMRINSVNVGATIMIERVGATVPQIKTILVKATKPVILEHCPFCNSSVGEDEVNYYCTNINCPEQIKQRFYYFCQSLNLKGLGEKSMKVLMTNCKDRASIIEVIKSSRSLPIAAWNKISHNSNITLQKMHALELLTAFGIENMSTSTLKMLLKSLDIESIRQLQLLLENKYYENRLKSLKIRNVGEKKLTSFIIYMKNHYDEILKCIKTIVQ